MHVYLELCNICFQFLNKWISFYWKFFFFSKINHKLFPTTTCLRIFYFFPPFFFFFVFHIFQFNFSSLSVSLHLYDIIIVLAFFVFHLVSTSWCCRFLQFVKKTGNGNSKAWLTKTSKEMLLLLLLYHFLLLSIMYVCEEYKQ